MKTLKRILLLALCINFLHVSGQSYSLSATVKGLTRNKVYLFQLYGDPKPCIDSANVDANGSFSLTVKDSYHTGLYKISMGKTAKTGQKEGSEKFINVIFNKENIAFTTNFDAITDSMKVTTSEENKVFYEFMKRNGKVNMQLDVLMQLPVYFPKTDKLYASLEKRFYEIIKEHKAYTDELVNANKSKFVSHLIPSKTYLDFDFKQTEQEKKIQLQKHFWKNVNFSDTALLYADIYPVKALTYLNFYSTNNMTKEDLSKACMRAMDTMMLKAAASPEAKKQIVKSVMRVLDKPELETALAYIVDKYVNENTCEDDKASQDLVRKAEGYKRMADGNIAPQIQFYGNDGKLFTLSGLVSPYTLVVFWASWCPHCYTALPALKKVYDAQKVKKMEVVAISVDSSQTYYASALLKGGYTWINYCDFKSFHSPLAASYYVTHTPTMILLDKDKKIIMKPNEVSEIEEFLKEKE